ncbi:MAG: DUF3168 domain-containing protein [Hyphomicrobiaceae bacterium]|nr:DUF3168 domain-containing protein [Hyphomicrobiaceae bacterium]
MAKSRSWNLQKGVYETLTSDTSVTGLLGGAKIFDSAPQTAKYPYLTVGESADRDWSTGSDESAGRILTLHVWTRADGEKQTHEIIDAIRTALKSGPVAVNDDQRVELRHEFSGARRDPNDEAYHGIVRYRAVPDSKAA